MEERKEFETLYYITAPFANSEEEITTSFIVEEEHVSEDQVISMNEHSDVEEDFKYEEEKTLLESKISSENNQNILQTDQISAMSQNDDSLMKCDDNSVTQKTVIENNSSDTGDSISRNMETAVKLNIQEDKISHTQASDSIDESCVIGDNTLALGSEASCSNPDDKLTCSYCFKTFTKSGNKMRHMRKVHNTALTKEIGCYIKCVECNSTFKHVNKLRFHLAATHKLDMTEERRIFSNMAAFKKWKCEIERKEMTAYSLRHGCRKTANGSKWFYMCHRSGKYETKHNGERRRMLRAQGTMKLGIVCTAAIYCEQCPDKVIVQYFPHHYGHGKETSFIQLTCEEQTAIEENVSNGIPFENLLDDIRDGQSQIDQFQMHFLKKKDIRFINNAFRGEEYNPGLSDAESVDQWVRQCCQMEDSPILFYKPEELTTGEDDFLLIIMTEFQKQILLSSDKQVICIDSLYRRKGGRFYVTVMFIMDEYDIAFPVAFCISNKVNKYVVYQFLTSIRESAGPLSYTYIMSDSEKFYYDAWVEVMNADAKWLWSMWYVDNRIRVQLRVFKGNILKRADTYKTMRALLECQNLNVFNSMFKNYIENLQTDPQSKNLAKFMSSKYGNNTEMWAYCHRRDIRLSTNIHMEVMHRTFRYCCREGRKKRLDKFILVIMKLVRYKMLGRLTNVMDEEKIGLATAAINMFHSMGLELTSDHISSLSDKIWLVRSDEDDENVYVTRDFETCPEHCDLKCAECDICVHMYSCSCVHSMINANLCQHIHAVVWKFLTPHFSPPESPLPEDNCVSMDDVPDALDVPENNSELLEKVLKRTHDVYKIIRSNKCILNSPSLMTILDKLNECVDISSGKKSIEEQPTKTTTSPNAVYVVNSCVKENSQPFLLPNNMPTILNNSEPNSQYIFVVPNSS